MGNVVLRTHAAPCCFVETLCVGSARLQPSHSFRLGWSLALPTNPSPSEFFDKAIPMSKEPQDRPAVFDQAPRPVQAVAIQRGRVDAQRVVKARNQVERVGRVLL